MLTLFNVHVCAIVHVYVAYVHAGSVASVGQLYVKKRSETGETCQRCQPDFRRFSGRRPRAGGAAPGGRTAGGRWPGGPRAGGARPEAVGPEGRGPEGPRRRRSRRRREENLGGECGNQGISKYTGTPLVLCIIRIKINYV